MRPHAVRSHVLPALLLLVPTVLAPPAGAAGRVSISWNACSPIVSAISSDGAHAYSAFVSVVGQAEPHAAYEWRASLARLDHQGPVPDAWRFDSPGCQGSGLIRIDHVPPALLSKACPAFDRGVQSLQIKDFSFDPLSGRAQILLSDSYPSGVAVVDPNVRYLLGRIEFEHTYSVVGPGTPGSDPGSPALTCGGFEVDMELSLLLACTLGPRYCPSPTYTRAVWLDMAGVTHDFEVENPTLTFCGSCGPTPAVRSTWGALKGRYRL